MNLGIFWFCSIIRFFPNFFNKQQGCDLIPQRNEPNTEAWRKIYCHFTWQVSCTVYSIVVGLLLKYYYIMNLFVLYGLHCNNCFYRPNENGRLEYLKRSLGGNASWGSVEHTSMGEYILSTIFCIYLYLEVFVFTQLWMNILINWYTVL